MGKGDETKVQPAAVMSRPFYLAHRVAELQVGAARPPKEKAWSPGDPVKTPFTPELIPPTINLPTLDADFAYYRVLNRWLYVFQWRDNKREWYAEYWIDDKGNHHPVDMTKARDVERNARPKPSNDALPLLSLPYIINGRPVSCGFYLSGTRLSLASIRRLEKEGGNAGQLWSDLDLYNLDPKEYDGAYYIPDRSGQSFLRVKDHLWQAASLNRIMAQIRDLAVGWITPAKDLDEQSRKRTEDRARKKLVAETIKSLVDGDPGDKLGLRDEFHPHPIQNYAVEGDKVMRQWLDDYNATVNWWMDLVEKAAGKVIAEFKSPVMGFVTESYRLLENVDPKGFEADMPLFVSEYALCVDRLSETKTGAAWIDGVLKDPAHFVHEYLLRDAPPEGVRFQVMRKSTAAFLTIWSELPVRHILLYGRKSTKVVVDTLNYLSLETLIKDRARITARNVILPGSTPIEKSSHWEFNAETWTSTGRRVIKSEVVEQPVMLIQNPADKQLRRAADKVFLAIELINLTLGLQTLVGRVKSGDKSGAAWAAVGALGSSLDAATAYGALTGWKKSTLLKISAVSAVIDTITSIHDAIGAADIGDIGAAKASGIIAGGSALIAAGYAMSFFGAGTAWSGVGIAAGIMGAVMVAIGNVVALFSSASPLELFVSHSVWGSRYGLDSGDKPWSAGSFAGWHESRSDGLANQVAAMTNLLAAFSVSGMRWGVRIQLGMVTEKSKVHVKFATDFMESHQEVEVVVDLAVNRTRVVDPRDPGRLDTGGTSPTYGADFVELKMNFRDDSMKLPLRERPLFENEHEMDCWVRLDYYGDGVRLLPPSGKWVHYRTKALAVAKAASSVDF